MAERDDLIPTAADYGRLLEDVPIGKSPASALRAPTPVPGLSVGDPSEFREPTLAGHVLGRYAPSSLLSTYMPPESREGAHWQRRVGGLLDDMIAAPALMWAPFAVKEGTQGIGAMRSAARAAEAAKGPWGNPRMLDDMLDSQPRIPRHEINAPSPSGQHTQRSPKELNAEREALQDEGIGFLLPDYRGATIGDVRQDPLTGKTYGTVEPRQPHGRYSYSAAERPITNDPADIAKSVRTHGSNNENIPGFYDRADALARRLEGLEASQQPDYRALSDAGQAWSNLLYGRNPGSKTARYYDDVDRFFLRGPKAHERGDMDFDMEAEDLRRILQAEFGANPRDPESMEKAYKAFWADEQARRAAGKMTRHEEEQIVQKTANRREAINRFGLDPDDPKQAEAADAAWRELLDGMKVKVNQAREGAERRMRGLPDPEDSPTMRSIADKTLRYGPPTAVGGYAGNELMDMWKDSAAKRHAGDILSESYGDPTGEWPATPKPPETPTPKGRTIPQIVDDEIGDAKFSKYGNAARLGVHSVFGPLGAAGFETKKGKAAWLAPQAILGLGAYDDMAKADDRLKFWEAMQKGYIDKLPTLDRDTIE